MIDERTGPGATEARRRELAGFLRARRESLTPDSVGLAAHGRRRTPGLRREEVAMLAEIGVGWYTKLEMAHDIKVSPATLLAISRALRLNRVETEYLFALAQVPMPLGVAPAPTETIPPAIDQLVASIQGAGVVLFDRYMTAMRWNAIGDAMFDIGDSRDPIERNAIVRIFRASALLDYFPDDFEDLVRDLVGIFRRVYVMNPNSAFAKKVYALVSDGALFRKYWNQRRVGDEVFPLFANPHPMRRVHAVVGEYYVLATDLQIVGRSDYTLRTVVPADAASAKKFKKLATLGKPSDPEAPPPGSEDADS